LEVSWSEIEYKAARVMEAKLPQTIAIGSWSQHEAVSATNRVVQKIAVGKSRAAAAPAMICHQLRALRTASDAVHFR
jgi:hypothetical protein